MEQEVIASITYLPNEVITLILRNNDCRDIVNFGSTCKHFNKLIKNNQYLWKEKIKQMIPKNMVHTVSIYCKDNWFQEIKGFYAIREKIYSEIISMSPKYYCLDDEALLHDVKSVFNIALSNNISYYYTIYILQDLIKKGTQIVDKNLNIKPYTLTDMYYAKIVLQYMIYAFLSIKWVQKSNKAQLTPEAVLCLFIQWIDVANIHSDEDIEIKVSGIIEEVEVLLSKKNPAIAKSSLKLREKVAQKLISEKTVLEAITEVIYHQRGIRVTTSATLKAFDMVEVLTSKSGNIVTVAIIYYFVVKQCGVKCNIIHFSYRFFLEWQDTSYKQKPHLYSLDIYTGELREQRNCPSAGNRQTENYIHSPNSLLRCIMNAYVKMLGGGNNRATYNTLQLAYLIEDSPYGSIYYNYRLYLQKQSFLCAFAAIDLNYIQDEYLHMLRNLSRFTSVDLKNWKIDKMIQIERDNLVKYAVGMVCYHKTYHYNCVIIGWDLTCDVIWESHPVSKGLQMGTDQPFYVVISDDQTRRYIAQENLVLITHPSRVYHVEYVISRYFTHFNGFAYVPNKEKEEEYPDDIPISNMFRDRAESKIGIEF